jgi:hypothetical protein
MTEFKLPEEITPIKETNPTDLIIISVPKTGKTNILAELTKQENAIIFNLEKGGVDYVSGKFINIYPSATTSFEEACENYKGYRDMLLKNKGKYKYLVVDSLTALDEMSEVMGTYYYMYSVPQGKNFNRNLKTGEPYKFGTEEFKLVTTLPEGYGYRYTREWFLQQIAFFSEMAPYRIYAGHVKDKLIKNSQDEQVTGSEINLTGKLKNILSTRMSSLCKLVADGDKRYLSFEVDSDNIIAGSRVPYLTGQILISEKTSKGDIKTYWENVYKK